MERGPGGEGGSELPVDTDGDTARSSAPSLAELQRVQSELWRVLRSEEDPDRRMALLSRLSDTRAAILDRGGASAAIGVHVDLRDAAPLAAAARSRVGAGEPPRVGSAPATRRPPSMFLPITAPPPPRAEDARTLTGGSPDSGSPDSGSPDSGSPDSGSPDGWAGAALVGQLRVGLRQFGTPHSGQRLLVLAGALAGVLGIASLVLSQTSGPTETAAGNEAVADDAGDLAARVAEMAAVVNRMGLLGVTVEQRGDTVHLGGTVGSEAERVTVVGVVEALAAGEVPVTSEIVVAAPVTTVAAAVDDPVAARVESLQAEINRLVAATPVIFETGRTDLTEIHVRILNNVAIALRAYPGFQVRIIGYTDHVGPADANVALSSARAESVKAYLVAQGVPEVDLWTEARGATTSSGSSELASLERRVEFEVLAPNAVPESAADATLRIAVVAPSASNDLAFTQSMVDAVRVVAAERGAVQADITDNTFVAEEAAAAIRTYADSGFDLIIAHGVEFGTELRAIVTDHPDVVFAWGTATDTFGLPNLYAYDAAAEEGGFVMGAMAARLTTTGTIGVVGPIEVADALRYIEGFKAGVVSQAPAANVPVVYTGSFGDIAAASEVAGTHIGAGADVLTGTAEMVVGAIAVARDQGVPWFGTQANQTSLAPEIVVASQVYHWEVALREVVADLDAGTPNGRSLMVTLANGGLTIEYNPDYPLPPEVRQLGDDLVAGVAAGLVAVPRPS